MNNVLAVTAPKGRQASVMHEDVDRLSEKVAKLIAQTAKERKLLVEALEIALQCIELSDNFQSGNPAFEQASAAIRRITNKCKQPKDSQ